MLLIISHRNCGAVVCGPCSPKKFLLPSSTKPQRVCLDCYDALSSINNQQVCSWHCEWLILFTMEFPLNFFRIKQMQVLPNWKLQTQQMTQMDRMETMRSKTQTKHMMRWVVQNVAFSYAISQNNSIYIAYFTCANLTYWKSSSLRFLLTINKTILC